MGDKRGALQAIYVGAAMQGASIKVSIDQRSRRLVREFKRKLAIDSAAIDRWTADQIVQPRMLRDFLLKKGKGRRRVFARIDAELRRFGARLEGVDLDGNRPRALWAFLVPHDHSVAYGAPRDEQPCITVDYLLLYCEPGRIPVLGRGLWSLEVTDHALGRWFQRGPNTDPSEALFAAHRAVLDVDVRDLLEPPRPAFRMRNASGVWICELHDTGDDDGEHTIHVMLRTYLDFNQIHADQELELITPRPEAEHRLVNTVLVPHPLRSDIASIRRVAAGVDRQ